MSDSLEIQKDTAIKSLTELRNKVINLQMNSKGREPSKSQLYEYDEVVASLDIYFISYAIYGQSLRDKLGELAIHPATSEWLSKTYDKVIILINSCIEEIRANFEFSTNSEINSLKVTVSRPYIFNLKEGIIKREKEKENLVENISELNSKLKQANSDKLKYENEKTSLEASINSFQGNINNLEKHLTSLTEANSNSEGIARALSVENATLNTELVHFKEQAQRTEIARNSTNFHNQAETNKKTAKLWGISIAASVILFLLSIYYIFSKSGELFEIATNISKKSAGIDASLIRQLILIEVGKRIGTKLLMVSIITYFITFLVKNYNAQMHNYIINSHKANALRSTVDLIGTAKQDDGNDKIILQATQAIFTPQKSGYQGAESEPSSPNLITNVVDAVSGGKKN